MGLSPGVPAVEKLWDAIRTPSKTFLDWSLPVVPQHFINLLAELIFPAWSLTPPSEARKRQLTHSLHNARLVCLLHEMIPGYRLHRWTSLWERSTLLKTRSPPFMKQGHLHWTIQSTFPCKHSLLRVWITSTSLKTFLLMAVLGMGQGSHAHSADWRKGDRNTPQIKTRLNLSSHSFSFHSLCHHHTPNLS